MVGFLVFLSVILLAYIVIREYSSRKRKPLAVATEKAMLHGYDLSIWNYLGYTVCSYVDSRGNTISEYPIFLFADKKNNKRRSYYIQGDSTKTVDASHVYVNKNIKPWKAGEGEIFTYISGKGNYPSDYLKQYMLEHYKVEWDSSTNWWGTSDKAKYTAAQNKQKKEHNTTEAPTKSESNVVSVNFGKKK